MGREVIFVIAFLLILLPFVSSVENSLGTFKQNGCVTLLQTCVTCTYVNISSVTYPNSTQAIGITPMNKVDTEFTYEFCNTSSIGTYIVNGYGDLDGSIDSFTYTFEINSLGYSFNTAKGILYLVFFISAVFVFGLSMWGSIVIPFKNPRDENGFIIGKNDLKYVKLFLIFMDYIILMSLLGMLTGILTNLIPELGIGSMFNWMYQLMLNALYPILVCFVIFAFIIWVNDRHLIKDIQRGIEHE